MTTTVKQMIAAADAEVPRITPAEARGMVDQEAALVVDVRDVPPPLSIQGIFEPAGDLVTLA